MKRHHPGIPESSYNVFADMELSNPGERFAKAQPGAVTECSSSDRQSPGLDPRPSPLVPRPYVV